MNGFDYTCFFDANVKAKLSIILQAENHVLSLPDGKARFVKEVSLLGQAYALSKPSDEAMKNAEEIAFFQAIKARLCKFDGDRHEGKHCFAQIVFCGECGEFYRRIHWNNRGCKSIVWRCCSRLENTGHACHSRTVNETLLEQVVIDAINRVLCKKDDFQQTLRANIATVVLQGDALSPEVIDERLNKLQKELLKKVNQKDDYDAIADEILRLRDQRRQAEVDSVIKDEQMKQIRELQDFVKSQPATITEFDETLVGRLIEKITVFEAHFTVNFKSGITINIEK